MESSAQRLTERLSNFFSANPEVIVLSLLMLIYLFLGNYFAVSATLGSGLYVSGGSDPYYNYRTISYIITNHHSLVFDRALNYPIGAPNPRTPFFHWFLALAGEILSPFLGLTYGTKLAFLEFDAVFGALLIIPVYLITAEAFGKKTGMLAAILYALMPSNLSSGVLSDGRMHTPELIFAFFTIYFFEKAINTINKDRLIGSLRDFLKFPVSVLRYVENNRLGTIYGALAGASMGALMLSWQGYAYIEAIILIYVFVQFIINILTKKNLGYLTFLTALLIGISFSMSAYYYIALAPGFAQVWFYPPLYLGLGVILFGMFASLFSRKPWILSLPSFVVIFSIILGAAYLFRPQMLQTLISGEGYFIKTRVYTTIAEASAPPLGQYISGFGPAQFILGMGGIAYVTYLFLRQRKDVLTFLLVFSIVSIYMSFAAARFNVTAAPAYAILGAALLMYFVNMLGLEKQLSKRDSTKTGIRRIKGNQNWITAVFSIAVILLLIIPSGFSTIASAVPANSATSINQQIYNDLPSFLQPQNFSASNPQFVGASGFYITNSTTPLSRAFSWLSTQDTNVPLNSRPAFVSWWDYGFQEISQGHHPTVADDFQQGYQVAGQILLAQNQSHVISLFIARVLQASYINNGSTYTPALFSAMSQYLGSQEAATIKSITADPAKYSYLIASNPTEYGSFIPDISAQNAYFALVSGQLSYNYPVSTIVNLYSALESITGYNIKYIGIDHSLLPLSGTNPGIFYAPTYLTDSPSYTSSGEIVPYHYYQIQAVLSNGTTMNLNQLPSGAVPVNYNIVYKPAFYNTTMYRFMFGYSPYDTGNTSGIPGLTFGQNTYTVMPAHNLSHFELLYMGIPWNPYKDYQNHSSAWKIIPLQQAYRYNKEGIGTTYIFPPTSQLAGGTDPIVGYYPGAKITGKVTMPSGQPVKGIYVTLFDQYGIPHDTTITNSAGYYNLTAVPGNDSILISYGKYNKIFDSGSNSIDYYHVHVSKLQAERQTLGVNATTGLPNYYFVHNFQLKSTKVSGSLAFRYQEAPYVAGEKTVKTFSVPVSTATITLYNQTNDISFSTIMQEGNYQFSNIPTYDYQVNVTVAGQTYNNITTIILTQGANVIQNLHIKKDSIFVSAVLGGKTLSGVQVTLTGKNTTVTNVTNSSGIASFWVNPGSYEAHLSGHGIISVVHPFSFTGWGNNLTANLTPSPSASVTGTVSGTNGPVYVYFYQNGLENASWQTLSSSNGAFNITLPLGIYTAYAGIGGQSAFQTFVLNSTRTMQLSLTSGAYINLTSNAPSKNTFTGYYEILSNAGIIKIKDNNPYATTSVFVPIGTYTVESQGISLGNIYSNTKILSIASDTTLNMSMKINSNVSVSVYSASPSASSLVSNGIVELRSQSSILSFQPVPASGYVAMYYPSSVTSGLSVSYISPYFSSVSSSPSSGSVALKAVPKMFHISVPIEAGGNPASYNGSMSLTGVGNYTFSLSSGTATGNLGAGEYLLKIASSEASISPISELFSVVAANSTIPLNVTVGVSLQVTGSQNSMLFNSSGARFSGPVLVSPGLYTVYSTGITGSNISRVYLDKNTTLTPTFSKSYNVTLENTLGVDSGNYILGFGSYTLNLSRGSYDLPAGTYSVSYSLNYSNSSGDFNIHGLKTVTVSSSATVNLSVTTSKVYEHLEGYAMYNGAPSAYTKVSIYTSKGIEVNSTNTNSAGWYDLTVSSGRYSVYSVNSASGLAYTGTVTVNSFSGVTVNNLTMAPGTSVSVLVTVGGTPIYTNVTVLQQQFKIEFNSSAGSIFLPLESYAFSASESYNSTYRNTTFTESYQTSITQQIGYGTYILIPLSRNYNYQFDLGQISGPGGAVATGTMTNFTFYLKNTGSSFANVTLSSGNGSWNMTFSKTKFMLAPGQNVSLNVTVNVSQYASAGTNKIPVIVNYGSGNYTGDLNLKVKQYYGFTLSSLNTAGSPYKNSILIGFQLQNTGNGKERVNLSANSSQYSAFGWTPSYLYDNKTVTSVTIEMNQTVTVYLELSPITSQKQQYITEATVYASLNSEQKNLTLTPQYPEIPVLKAYPVGTSISNYTGNPYSVLLIGIGISAVAIISGIAVAVIRGRKKK